MGKREQNDFLREWHMSVINKCVCVSTLIYTRQTVTGLTSVATILHWTFHREGLEVIEEDSRQLWHVLVSSWLAWGNIHNADLLSQQTYCLHWVLPPATPNSSLKVGWNPSFCVILLIKINKHTDGVKTVSSWVEVIKKKEKLKRGLIRLHMDIRIQ